MKRRAVITCVVVGLLVGLLLLTGTSGGIAYFSPYTLEYETQSEFTILNGALPVFRSSRREAENELVTFLKQERLVDLEQPYDQRWELIFHWNHAWRGGYGTLYDVLIRHRREIIEWSKADRERARLYWSEGLKHLRSGKESDVRTGQMILLWCWRAKNTQELRQQIAAVKRGADLRD